MSTQIDTTDDSVEGLGTLVFLATVIPAIAALVGAVHETNFMVFEFFGQPFWQLPGEALLGFWFIPLWAFGMYLLTSLINRRKASKSSTKEILMLGFLISLWAGVVEELLFRWGIFMGLIAGIQLADLLMCGLASWVYENILMVIVNFVTFGVFEPLIYHPAGWFVGAAIISASAMFRKQHAYQGLPGFIDSWIFSFVMFHVVLSQGILACIILHFTFNMTVFTLLAAETHFRKTF